MACLGNCGNYGCHGRYCVQQSIGCGYYGSQIYVHEKEYEIYELRKTISKLQEQVAKLDAAVLEANWQRQSQAALSARCCNLREENEQLKKKLEAANTKLALIRETLFV